MCLCHSAQAFRTTATQTSNYEKISLTKHQNRMKTTLRLSALLLALAATVGASAQTVLSQSDITSIYKTKTKSRVSVHDPSVIYDRSANYYIFGSHLGIAKSSDLQNWESVDNSSLFGVKNSAGGISIATYATAFNTNQTTKVTALVNGKETEIDFGNFDAEAWCCALNDADGNAWSLGGVMWAPDIIYNETMGKWCFYLSLNGYAWNSVIILLTADKITGPYVYQGPVVYSGFKSSDAAISWKQTDLEIVLGEQSSLPSRYNKGQSWGNYWPNNIDPCVFYDEDGQLWMSYGSWSGGIFILKLNNENGLRDYTVTYPLTTDSNGRATSDPYFGTRIAGGYYVSGEASYIEHIGDYYWLFMTNGELDADGGYNMRTFRSENPDGPYVDYDGNSALYSKYMLNYGVNEASTHVGNMLMTSYKDWGFMTTGELSQGHNSALLDTDGRAYVVYHTRFNDGTEGHSVRVHQLFTNEDGWLVAAPFEFDGETLTDDSIKAGCKYTADEIAGDYQLLIHPFNLDNTTLECATPISITLGTDGKITGDKKGSWSMTDGTGYIKLVVAGTTYNGVVTQQTLDGTTLKAIGISALSTTGSPAWAYKMEPASYLAYYLRSLTYPVKAGQAVSTHLDLELDLPEDIEYHWTSTVPEVLSDSGKYNPADTDTEVTLTATITYGGYQFEKSFNVTAKAATEYEGDATSALVAFYDFNSLPITNYYNEDETATLGKQSAGTVPTLETNIARFGQILHVYGGTEADKTASYAFFDNPLYGQDDLTGFTVSCWVKRADEDLWGTLWAFTPKSTRIYTTQNNFALTGNDYLNFTNGTDTFSINYPTTKKDHIAVGEWSLVTITASVDNGVTIYINGSKKYSVTFASTMGTAKKFDYQLLIDFIKTCQFFTLGKGLGLGTAEAWYDDLLIYNRELTATDVKALYYSETRITDISTNGEAVGITAPTTADAAATTALPQGIYDLSGRRLDRITRPGLYIVDGKKVLVK